MRALRLKFEGIEGCTFKDGRAIKSAVVREISVGEQEQASEQARARGGSASVEGEALSMAVVEVNGKPVAQPYLELTDWLSVPADLLAAAFRKLNGNTKAVVDAFLAAAVPIDLPSRGVAAAAEQTD